MSMMMSKPIMLILKTLTVVMLAATLGACTWVSPLLGKKDRATQTEVASTAETRLDSAKTAAPTETPQPTPETKAAAASSDVTVTSPAAASKRLSQPAGPSANNRIKATIPMRGAPTLQPELEPESETATADPKLSLKTTPAKPAKTAKRTVRHGQTATKAERRATAQSRRVAQKGGKRTSKKRQTPASKDLWGRIRGRMALVDLQHPRIDEYIARLKRNPGYINLFAQRAQPYMHYLVDHIDRSGLPLDLVVVPMVESAFQPTAVSPKAAAGLWQIIPSTGREHGLVLEAGYDGRMDIHSSTDAALRYLRYLNKLFKGDWLLALAAYNAGPGAVQRAIRAHAAEPPPPLIVPPPETNPLLVATLSPAQKVNLTTPIAPPVPSEPESVFWSLKLPKETQDYVPRIVALAHVIADPTLHGVKLQKIANQPYLYRVELNAETKIFDSITAAGISNEDFLRFNPGFKLGVEPPTQPYKVLLPQQQAEMLASVTPGARLLAPVKYTVQAGETLDIIAKRHGVSPQTLAKWNSINPKRGLRAGQKLTIYPASS